VSINQGLLAQASLAIPVLAGIIWMALGNAPTGYLLVNCGALVLALAAWKWLPQPRSLLGESGLALAMVAMLFATAFFGEDTDGVRRWFTLGPIRLHAGYLILPLLVVLTMRQRPAPAATLLIAALAICTLQPDRAAVLALAAATAARVVIVRDRFSFAAAIAALGAAIVVWSIPDPLASAPFVEQVLQDAWASSFAAGAALFAASLAPATLLIADDRAALPLVALMLAAGLAALLGAYPSVLIGYGAAPILGMGLALAALRRH
jgi:hypothetical protein